MFVLWALLWNTANWCSEVEPEGQRKMCVTVSHAAFTICLGFSETFQGLFALERTKELIGWLEIRSWIKFNKVQKALQAAGWKKPLGLSGQEQQVKV